MTDPLPRSPHPRVRVLIRRFPPIIGGMERQCQALCERWAAGGVAVEVWTRRIVAGGPDIETTGGYRVRRLRPGGLGRGGEYGSLPIFASRLIRDRAHYDVAAVFGSGWLALAAGLAARRARRPWLFRPATAGDVTRFVDPGASPGGGPMRGWLRARIPPPSWRLGVLHQADAVVAVSDEIAGELARWGFEASRIVRIPNGVDIDRLRQVDAGQRAVARVALGLPANSVIVLFLGRLVARKGVIDLVQAWRQVQAEPEPPPSCLVIVGSGVGQVDSVEKELQRMVGVDTASLRLVGAVGEPAPWLAAADVFVLPSHAEGLSNALLEAMASGLAIVASDLPSTREVVGGGAGEDPTAAWLVRPGDVDRLAEALRAAIADAEGRESRGQAARVRAVAAYGLDAAAERYLALFRRMTGGAA